MNADSPRALSVSSLQDSIDPACNCLLGSRCPACGTYRFPRQTQHCRNPDCEQIDLQDIVLSRSGRIWSFTNACVRPPEPYPFEDPFVPFSIAAVWLETEALLLLGPVVAGVGVEQLSIGLPMELVIERVHADVTCNEWLWKWRPVGGSSPPARRAN